MKQYVQHLPVITENNPNFIGVWSLNDITFTDLLIDFFNSNQMLQMDMKIVSKNGNKIDENVVKGKSILNMKAEGITNTRMLLYFKYLNECYKNYLLRWPTIIKQEKLGLMNNFELHKYVKGSPNNYDPFYKRNQPLAGIYSLSFITFLNSVEKGGELEFYYHGTSIKAYRGVTVIYPSDWTHASKITSNVSDDLYIIRGDIGYYAHENQTYGVSLDTFDQDVKVKADIKEKKK
tara:strand:+ start:2708 stop:3409 length:702 start_codon:yes stop_codon:yes gene_type:complete